ncbi:VOC family protein [Eoetvoesiella caeni]|uniref:Catechol 2,3-dioxygenase-like lactoylglutathione lyase family enzyme n=1 Tax=Eoetvoesiella caeni TaxID=645616 RepID=A0A366H9G5_9BURK|nr:VOC family protein [Eoetvoesiella caeni]MCI2809852.1 VOC family protein [Eoetvoesiella caeni]NYT56231.1 VOC family protein [Eoetvoesiella caeni]RBP38289.1 catechol 2,3-dioxygenase-like lactoylglutathione lyase family enzyme [Eoetvoesiella caeni]
MSIVNTTLDGDERGPVVYLDYDQASLDAAYDQSVWASNAARLRHFAICVNDLEASADFYQKTFGLKRVGEETLEAGSGVYLSDGVVNLALLKGSPGSQMEGFVGPHHFGFIVQDSELTAKEIEANGGKFFFTLGDPEKQNFEQKFKDPDGIVFDISRKGWLGTSDV